MITEVLLDTQDNWLQNALSGRKTLALAKWHLLGTFLNSTVIGFIDNRYVWKHLFLWKTDLWALSYLLVKLVLCF